jgi:CheY-like chemotaxis protein
MPDMVGWTILDRLKYNPATRHIPVHIISGDEDRRRGLALGAMTYLEKSTDRASLQQAFTVIARSAQPSTKNVLVVTSDLMRRSAIDELIGSSDLELLHARNEPEVQAILAVHSLDCVIIDLRLQDVQVIQLIALMTDVLDPVTSPIILYGKRKLTNSEEIEIQSLRRKMVVKHAQSPEALLECTALLLHRCEEDLSDRQRDTLAKIRQNDAALSGRKVLVIDDDLRNIFALTSVLEQHELQVLHAENGRTGIETLRQTNDVDAVLMDIMMPEMDGYETTRAIRQIPEFRSLPIIALTAKAMKGDHEKCLQAGASDYVTKPVDLDHLFSVLRVWISRNDERLRTSPAEAIDWSSETAGSR